MSEQGAVGRAGWFAAADRLLDALAPFRLDSGAGIRLPGRHSWSGPRADLLEGFARSFLLLALRVAGAHGEDPAGLLPRYRAGLLAGTDPDHDDRWIPIVDRGQALVEAASIAIGLQLTRPWLWDTLDEPARRRVGAWLAPSALVATPQNNWVLFPVVVQEFLAGAGLPFDPGVIRAGLARIDDWYEGDGWYRDGDGQNFDYYNAWAMHVYPLLWARMAAERDPRLADRIRERSAQRLRAFLPSHLRFFGADGTPIFFGRSLSYRFAALAPLWLGELHGLSPLRPGQTRRLTSRVLHRFLDGGALDEAGVLTSGWLGPFPPMIQAYSGPASPYWASKGFIGLLLPEDAPVWTAAEEPTPVERSDAAIVLPGPGWLLSTTAADGVARLVNHGSDHHPLSEADAPLYDRLGYSSATAPSFERDPLDQHVAILTADGRASRRGRIERLRAPVPGTLASRHVAFLRPPRPSGADSRSPRRTADARSPAADDAGGAPAGRADAARRTDADDVRTLGRIATASLVHGPAAVHLHVVQGAAGSTIRIGGYAVAGAAARAHTGQGSAEAVGAGLRSRIVDLRGRAAVAIHRSRDTSPYPGEVAVPTLSGVASGQRSVHVAWTCLTGAGLDPPDPPLLLGLEDDGASVGATLRFADGSVRELAVAPDAVVPDADRRGPR